MATIGELVINMRASTAAFAADLDKAKALSFESTKEIQRSFSRIGAVIATELAAAATAVTMLVAKSIDAADKMGKMAQRTGMSVEQFSGLAYAAKLSDVEVDGLSRSMVILARNLETANEQSGKGRAAHAALSSIFHGNIPTFKNTSEAFIAIAEQLNKLPDGMQKSALAALTLGRNGAALIPMFRGLRDAVAEAKDLGIIVTPKTAAAAEQFNDTIKRMEVVVEALGLRLAEQLLPYLQSLADLFLANARNAATAQGNINAMADAVRVLATVVLATAGAFRILGNVAGVALTAFAVAGSGHGLSERLAMLKSSLRDVATAAKETHQQLDLLWNPPAPKAMTMDQMLDAAVKWAKRNPVGGGLGTGEEDSSKKIQGIIDKMKEQVATFGMSATQVDLWKLKHLGASQEVLATYRKLADELKKLTPFKEWAFWAKEGWGHVPTGAEFIGAMGTGAEIKGELTTPDYVNSFKDYEQTMKQLAADIERDYAPATEKAAKMQADLDWAMKNTNLSAEKARQYMDDYKKSLGLVSEESKKAAEVSRQARMAFESMLTNAIFHAQSFTGALAGILESIAELIFKVMVLEPLMNSMFGSKGGGGGWFGGLLGGIGGFLGLAGGGPAYAGSAYVVGESGPELFFPSVTGAIVPNGALGGSQVVYNIDARGADPTVEFRIRRAIADAENRAVARSVGANREARLRSVTP